MPDDIQRDLGRHDAEIVSLRAELAAQKLEVEKVNDKLDQILSTLHEAKGGWKTLMAVAGAAGAAGSILTKLGVFFLK